MLCWCWLQWPKTHIIIGVVVVAHAAKSLVWMTLNESDKYRRIILSDYYVQSQQSAQTANDIMTQQFSGVYGVSSVCKNFFLSSSMQTLTYGLGFCGASSEKCVLCERKMMIITCFTFLLLIFFPLMGSKKYNALLMCLPNKTQNKQTCQILWLFQSWKL